MNRFPRSLRAFFLPGLFFFLSLVRGRTEEPNPLRTPLEAVAKMTLPDGFAVDVLASEPSIVQPIAFCWDEHGRIWLVEGNTYPQRAGRPPVPRPDDAPDLDQLSPEDLADLLSGSDRILILSDENGDGVYETRKVFMEGLNLVSGIEVGFGGVYVGAAPYLLHIPLDAAGDRPAGAPRVLADGFGWQDTHETLNSFIWGPDGWLYGCHGVFTQSQVRVCTGPPRSQRPRTAMNCAYWRWHPLEEKFETFAQGTSNPWGFDYDSKGQFFSEACVIPHFWHVIQGAYYLRQSNPLGHFNPYVYRNIETIADHAHFVGATWSAARDISDGSGGGHAHCGLCLYQGDHFPAEYKNRPLFGNIHGKRINQENLIQEGSGYRAAHLPDFLKSNDFNFTAVTLRAAPDGSMVFSDWYDRQKCHSRQSEIWDRSNGRLYRVRYQGWKPWREQPGMWSPENTLELQLQENAWLSRMARRKAAEQAQAIQANAALVKKAVGLVEEKGTPTETVLRVMWWMHCAGVDPALTPKVRENAEPYVRFWDVQLKAEKPGTAPVAELLESAKSDPSPVVRLAVTSALQRIPNEKRWEVVEALLRHEEDNADHNLPQMVWFAIEPAVPEAPERALALAKGSKMRLPAELMARRVAELQTPEARALLVGALTQAVDANEARLFLFPLVEALKGRFQVEAPARWDEAYLRLEGFIAAADTVEAGLQLRDARTALAAAFGDARAFPELKAVVGDSKGGLPRRQQALQTLASAKAPAMAELLLEMLSDPVLRVDVLRASATVSGNAQSGDSAPERFVRAVVERYPAFSGQEKAAAVLALAARKESAGMLLDAVEAGRIPRGEVSSFAARQIAGLKVAPLQERLEKVWGTVRSGDSDSMAKVAAEEHAKYKAMMTPGFLKGANLSSGRQLFKNSCGQCHQLFGEGGHIGPDLTGSNRADLDYILENVTNPNALIGKDYELHVFTLKDGRLVSGMVREQTGEIVTVQLVGAEERVRRSEIVREEKPGISMMPAGLFAGLTREQMRDLVGYLGSARQVALPGESDPGVFRVAGAVEGEALKVLSAGFRAVPQKMSHFRDGVWSGDSQLWWTGGKPGDVLKIALPVAKAGRYRLKAVFSRAPDYAVVKLGLNGKEFEGGQIDLFGSKVTNTQELTLGELDLDAREHEFSVEVTGANPAARPAYMVGIDYLLLEPVPAR
jgi:putative membrane-bound dehydrogenase-like protein